MKTAIPRCLSLSCRACSLSCCGERATSEDSGRADGGRSQPSTFQSIASTLSSLSSSAASSSKSITGHVRRLRLRAAAATSSYGWPAQSAPAHTSTDVDEDAETDATHADDAHDHFNDHSDLAASIAGSPSSSNSPASAVIWSAWDSLTLNGSDSSTLRRRVLIAVHADGSVAMWDAQDINEARLVFRLDSVAKNAAVLRARLVPHTTMPGGGEESSHPALLVLLDDNTLCAYSLASHRVLTRVGLPGPGTVVDVQVNEHAVVASTIDPLALHILDPATLQPTSIPPILDIRPASGTHEPVFTLSRSRMLAYASTRAVPDEGTGIVAGSGWDAPSGTSNTRRTTSFSESDAHAASQPVDIGETARRLGEGMMSGMKALGEFGYNRYVSHAVSRQSAQQQQQQNTRFSRSAPQAPSPWLSRSPENGWRGPGSASGASGPSQSVVVVDLVASLRTASTTKASARTRPSARKLAPLKIIAHFKPSKAHPIRLLSFSPNGTHLLTSSSEGHSFHIFELRPPSRVGSSPARHARLALPGEQGEQDMRVWHRYRLNRGLTVASAVHAAWSDDSRFVAVTTGRGTAHVFAINPYGGKPSPETHLSGTVKNLNTLQPLSVTLNALVRIRPPRPLEQPGQKTHSADGQDEEVLPATVVPPNIVFLSSGDTLAALRTPPSRQAAKDLKAHLLAFYPHLSNVVMSRLTLSATPKTAPADAPLAARVTSQAMSGLSQVMRSGGGIPSITMESEQLVAHELKLAYYPLGGLEAPGALTPDFSKLFVAPLRARHPTSAHQAEIITFSSSPAVLPRSIYTSSRFDFHAYPPSPATSLGFSKGIFVPLGLKRLVVRAEVGRTRRYPSSEDEGEELRTAMHSILDISSDLPRSASPAFPNGYGKTSHALRWKEMAHALPIRGAISSAHTISKSMERMRGLRSPRTSSGTLSVSGGLEVPRMSVSFEEEDESEFASVPSHAAIAIQELEEDGIDLGSSAPPLSLDAGSSDTGAGHDTSPEVEPSVSIAVEGEGREEDEWAAWKLDGVDDDTQGSRLLSQTQNQNERRKNHGIHDLFSTLPAQTAAPAAITPGQPHLAPNARADLAATPSSLSSSPGQSRKKKSKNKKVPSPNTLSPDLL